MIFLKRKPGLSLAQFRAYYEDAHVPLCMRYMQGAELYRRTYLADGDGPFDVITELAFASAKTRDLVLDTLARDAMPADVIADEANLFDRSKSRACAVERCDTALGES